MSQVHTVHDDESRKLCNFKKKASRGKYLFSYSIVRWDQTFVCKGSMYIVVKINIFKLKHNYILII